MITLADVQNNTQDDIQAGVIDEFRKSSYLFQAMPFDNAVSPGTNGGALTYGYTRLATQATAATRKFNDEYTPQHATKQRFTVDLKVFGGAFELDRVFTDLGGLVDEVTLQTTQKTKATVARFHDLAINGDSAADEQAFDGLSVALAESSTEYGAEVVADWTGAAVVDQADALKVAEGIDEWLALMDERPTAILANREGIAALQRIARLAGSKTTTQDSFGEKITQYDDVPLIDLGEKPGSAEMIIPTEERTVAEEKVSALTDLYAVRLAEDGLHGVTLRNPGELIRTYLDEFKSSYQGSDAARRGEVEFVGAMALKATKAAAVFRNIRVA